MADDKFGLAIMHFYDMWKKRESKGRQQHHHRFA